MNTATFSQLVQGTEVSMQYTCSFASAFLFQLLLSFWGIQWNPNSPSCAQLLSKMLKYVFIQLILPFVASAKEGWLMQNYMPFLLFFLLLKPLVASIWFVAPF